jgi:hypothetical protein
MTLYNGESLKMLLFKIMNNSYLKPSQLTMNRRVSFLFADIEAISPSVVETLII